MPIPDFRPMAGRCYLPYYFGKFRSYFFRLFRIISDRARPLGRPVSRCQQWGLIFADSYRHALPSHDRGSCQHRGSFWLAVNRSPPHPAGRTKRPIDTLFAWLMAHRRNRLRLHRRSFPTPPRWAKRGNLKRLLGAFEADEGGARCAARFWPNHPHSQRLRPLGSQRLERAPNEEKLSALVRLPQPSQLVDFSFPSSPLSPPWSLPVFDRFSDSSLSKAHGLIWKISHEIMW